MKPILQVLLVFGLLSAAGCTTAINADLERKKTLRWAASQGFSGVLTEETFRDAYAALENQPGAPPLSTRGRVQPVEMLIDTGSPSDRSVHRYHYIRKPNGATDTRFIRRPAENFLLVPHEFLPEDVVEFE